MKKWFLLLLIILAIYSPSLNGPFFFDDTHTVANNQLIKTWDNIFKIWTSSKYYSSLPTIWVYRPVTTFSNLVLWNVGAGSTWPFHLFKIFIFFGMCVFLYKIWRQLLPFINETILFIGLLIFAINPVHTQVVSYIAATSTLLAGFFICLGTYFYLCYRKSLRKQWFILSLIAIFLATLAKEEGVVGAIIIPFIEIYLRKTERRSLLDKSYFKIISLYALISIAGVGLIFYMYESTTSISRGHLSPWLYFMTQWRAYIRYIFMYFVSYDLNADNLTFEFSKGSFDLQTIFSLIANILIIFISILQFKKAPYITLSLAWFYVGLLPASSFVVLAEPVNDHRAFIGYLGFSILGVTLLHYIEKRSRIIFLVLISSVISIYSISTFMRAHTWSDNLLLWRDTIKKNPKNGRAHNNLASALMGQALYSEALGHLDKCIEYFPLYGICYTNKATVLAELGRDSEAEVYFKKGTELDKGSYTGKFCWAKFLYKRRFLTRSAKLLKEIDTFTQGNSLDVRFELIQVELSSGNEVEAHKLWDEIKLNFSNQTQVVDFGKRLGLK